MLPGEHEFDVSSNSLTLVLYYSKIMYDLSKLPLSLPTHYNSIREASTS